MPIQIRRGNLSDLPASAVDGQPLFTEDTHELYFGLGASVVPLTIDAANVNGLPPAGGTVTQVNTGTGLTGGPITGSGTISLANTTVSPNSYTNTNLTVDAQGRITAASNGSGTTSFDVNGTPVTDQTLLNFQSGTDITVSNPSAGNLSFAFSGQLAQTFAPVTNEFLIGYDATTGLFSSEQAALTGLSDVSLVSLVAGDILVWNGSAWINESYDPSLDVAWSNLQSTLSNGQVIPYADAGISRLGAASLAIGNGTAGDFTGSLKLAGLITSPIAGNGDVQLRLTNNESGTYGDDLFTIDSAEINTQSTRPLGYSGNVGVTNGSQSVAAVTGTFEYYPGGSYSNSPWTGLNITIGGVNYKIAVVTGTDALTLVKPYAGSTGTVAASVVYDATDQYDHVMQWGYNQNGGGGYDNPALQFAYHWALESNWTGQGNHDAVMERHQALSLSGYGPIIEKRTDYGQGWKTGYNNPPGFFQDFHAKDLEVWEQVFAVDTVSVQVSAGPTVTIIISNPQPNQLVSAGAEVNLSGFTNASNLWLNGQTGNVETVLSNGFTLYNLTSIPSAYGPAADYVTLGPFLNYMTTSVAGLTHYGNITSLQQVLAGAVSLGGYNGNAGPSNTFGYDSSALATIYHDISGGAFPTLPNALFGVGSIYIANNGQAYQNINGSWVGVGAYTLSHVAPGTLAAPTIAFNATNSGFFEGGGGAYIGTTFNGTLVAYWTSTYVQSEVLLKSPNIEVYGGGNLQLDGSSSGSISLSSTSTGGTLAVGTGGGDYSGSLNLTNLTAVGTIAQSTGQVHNWNADAGISRLGAASLAIGNGTSGDFTGSLKLANLSISGTLTDSASSAGTSNQVLTVSASTGKPVWAVAAGGGSGNKISRGTNAAFKSSPPATPATGDMYVCSDSPFSYVYDGAAWQAYVFGYNVTEPTPSTVSVIDGSSGGYVQDTSHGGYIIQCPSGSSSCLAILKANPGSGAYYVDIAFMTYIPGTNGGNGVCLADGTTTSNKLVSTRLGYESSNWPILERQRWNSVDSWDSNVSILSGAYNGFLTYGGPLVWFRIYDDGTTNITYYISSNGYVWNQLYQEGRTAWLTPAYAGFILSPASPATAEDCHLVHLSVHA